MNSVLYLLAVTFLISCGNHEEKPARTILNFDNDWYFTLNDSVDLSSKNLPNSQWERIAIPHDWSIEGELSAQNPSGNRGAYAIGGIGWYKKTFEIPVDQIQKNVILLFEGIYKDADIWVNGHHVGFHKHGYLSFHIDITAYVKFDRANTILLKVDNTDLPHDRWYSGCGIYRHVRINYVSDIHIPIWGTYITTPEISKEKAVVKLHTTIANRSNQASEVSIETSIVNQKGEIQATQKLEGQELGDSTEVRQTIAVPFPRLWTLHDPHLYKAIQRIYAKNKLLNETETSFGIRSISFSADKGFLLNGDSVFLKGVNIHHDAGCEGAAVSDHTWYTRLLTLKEMGVNSIRLSHNPHAPQLLNMCDTMGILLISEAFDKWAVQKSFGFRENWKSYTKDFIDRDRNHPSVIIWSLGNEVKEALTPLGTKIIKDLAGFVHEYEPTRPVTVAIQPPGHADDYKPWDIAYEMDIVSLNYQSQFYAQDREKNKFIILGSEMLPYYTRNNIGMIQGKTQKYLPVNPYTMSERYAIGHIIWAGIDYLGEAVQPWPLKGWENAPISTAGFKKPFYYFMQSLYSDKPVVHLAVLDKKNTRQTGKYGWDWPNVASHWNWEPTASPLEIFVYSNCDSVALMLNGRSLGINKKRDADKLFFVHQVPFEPGVIVAKGMKDGKEYFDSMTTAKEAHAIQLSASRKMIPADLNETCHLIAEIFDENGKRVQHVNHDIKFTIEGPGEIVGVDNGDLWSLESYKTNHRETRDGKCMAVLKATGKGEIRVKAEAAGLSSSLIVLQAR